MSLVVKKRQPKIHCLKNLFIVIMGYIIMSDIQKIQIIHDLKSTFIVSDNDTQKLINQIIDKNKKNNIDRFFRGYSVEDNFLFIASALPWVRLIHSLEQQQFPESSKSEFQAPDYTIFFENFMSVCFPIFVEVKSVRQKRHIDIMLKQSNLSSAYSKIFNNTPLVYAIYWENWHLWTINTQDQFTRKKARLTLNCEDAMKNDISTIFGNVVYFIPQLFRITIFNPSLPKNSDTTRWHNQYGVILSDTISKNKIDFTSLNFIDSSILDSFAKMEKVSLENIDGKIILKERTESVYLFDLLTLIIIYVASISDGIEKGNYINLMVVIHDFMEKLDIKFSHKIPSNHTNMAYSLYKTAFSNTSILNDYQYFHKITD